MNIHSFGKVTAAIIILTPLAFLGLFAAGHIASPSLMTPWSSLAYLAVGCSLWIHSTSENGAQLRAGALLTFAIGAVVCIEYLAGAGSTAFDRLIFPSHLPLDALLPGRPAAIAGIRFCLLGVVMFLARSRKKPVVLVREWSAIAVIVMCYFGFVSVVIEWGTTSAKSMSPVAGILGILAAANLLATGQNGHFLPLLQDRGPAGMIARSLMPAAMILPVLNAILGLAFAHFRLYDSTGEVALLSINILTAITILWMGASKVQGIDLLRRNAEAALGQSEERFRLAVKATNDAIWDVDLVTGTVTWNDTYSTLYERPAETSDSWKWWSDRIHPEDRDRAVGGLREAIGSGASSWACDYRFLRADGGWAYINDRSYIARDGLGNAWRVVGAMQDLTDRKRAEAAMRESDLQYREVFDNISACLFLVDVTPDGRFKFVGFNPAEEAAVGLSTADVSGKFVEEVFSEELARKLTENYRRCLEAGRAIKYDDELNFPSGRRYFHSNLIPLQDAAGSIKRIIGACIDITDLKRTQEEALAKQNLESLGVLASGIAHDFNNLLGGISALAELIEADLAVTSVPCEEIQKIKAAAIRGSEIVRELMVYAGQDESQFVEAVDLSSLVEEMLELVKVSISKHAVLRTDLAADLPRVPGNAPKIRQVVMNLVINASEAIGAKHGLITLTTTHVRRDKDLGADTSTDVPQGDFVRLEVSDTGCGIGDAGAKIFEPFFSTKFAGRGMGLAVVKGIVRDHGGTIDVESVPGQGTTFRVLLPCSAKSAAEVPRAMPVSDPTLAKARTGMILVVEDEELLREAVSKLLRRIGFHVVEAGDGSHAIELMRKHKDDLRAVLLDVTLPGISSREVLAEALRIRPDLNVVVTSAYSKELVEASFAGLRIQDFIRKPFHLSEMVRLLDEPVPTEAN